MSWYSVYNTLVSVQLIIPIKSSLKFIKRSELSMAMRSLTNLEQVETKPKKTKQGRGQHTKYSATSRNKAKKRYRGQGKK